MLTVTCETFGHVNDRRQKQCLPTLGLWRVLFKYLFSLLFFTSENPLWQFSLLFSAWLPTSRISDRKSVKRNWRDKPEMQTLLPIQRRSMPSGSLLKSSWNLLTNTIILRAWEKVLNGLGAFNILAVRVSHKPRSANFFYKGSESKYWQLSDHAVSVTATQLCHCIGKIAIDNP